MTHHLRLVVSAVGFLLLLQNSSAGHIIPALGQNQNGASATQAAAIAEAEQLASQVVKLYQEGKFDQALPLAQRLLELRQRTAGADHFLTGQALENLAELFLAKGKKKDAKAYYEKALPNFEKSAPEKEDVIVILERYVCTITANEEINKFIPTRRGSADHKDFGYHLVRLYNGFDVDTQILKIPLPSYPPVARLNHISGGVVIKITVAETGKVIKVQSLCGDPGLAKAAAAAAAGTTFKPASIAGKPIQFVELITYRFD
jgi:TonB family protein